MSQKKHEKKQTGIAILVIVALALVVALVIFLMWRNKQQEQDSADPAPVPSSQVEDGEYEKYNGEYYRKKDLDTVLIMGTDKSSNFDGDIIEGSVNQEQADLLLLLLIDSENETITPIQINRETITLVDRLNGNGEVTQENYEQICLAHAYGSGGNDSCRNEVKAVSGFLDDVEIDHYIAMSLDSIDIVNDLVGGVTVTVEDNFTGVDDTLVQGQTVLLQGEHAETFVRSRESMPDDTSNANRQARQQVYLEALLAKGKECVAQDDAFIMKALLQLGDYMNTDCSANALSDIANAVATYEVGEILTPEGETVMGEKFSEFYADEEQLLDLIMTSFYEKVDSSEINP